MKGKTNAHKSIRTSSVEFVTVNVTVPEGLTGYEVTITEVSTGTLIAKQTTPSETYKIPHGVEVLVKPGQVIGHKTPKEQLFITSLSSRTVSVIYDDSAFGVLIYGNDGKLYAVSSWTQGSNATGVALITDNVALVIAPNNWYSTYSGEYDEPWNGNSSSVWGGYGKLITGIKTTLNESDAITDFEGSVNTDAIIAQGRGMGGANVYYDGVPAAEYCRAYSHGCKGVGEWYLPAAGEVNEMALNRAKIEVALSAISGELFTEPGEEFTSTQESEDSAWVYKWFEDKFDSKLKIQPYGVRPVCAL